MRDDGKDFDAVMRDSENLSDTDWEALLSQLGESLSRMHTLQLDQFGLIKANFISGSERRDIPAFLNWREFVDTMLCDREKTIQSIDDGFKCGDVSGADIKKLFNQAKSFYLANTGSLENIKIPFLTHNDMRMGNVMAKHVGGVWQLASIIDHEWVLAGDPDIDLIQIENWLQFAPYKEKFIRYKKSFIESYIQNRAISKDFERKRRLYNMVRSISYLAVVFSLRDFAGFIAYPQNVLNVQKHFGLLEDTIDLSKNIEEIF
jgi:fructosamine-3-kinase